ncbi:PREDICTED: beta-adducin isoform X1 [Poecilia mexicana]|uniref:Class II aldolase/adducin N-terminal domain-containing protein n=1 Tax=Poecilia mexicana TaxID=48701 RepID=A0A3B3YGJ2_9TELE|nr:PREDICTED: beta-adducin isoform X1 [Poecilia mexicana]XP_014858501.1 PREDICTED: beta-adducin isoform X1 [Poecilia mexicana]XP_014858502.1 PREDICTED: beta-adducin isoform X1 [Poecilia mexicana]XP_014858503.1 PREDICTED: beta-adducin isoform X1 [Poecilia mexicana]
MSKSPTPKGTPVQRSPSDGVPESLQSPQHSTPVSGHKKRISSLLQSPSFREELDVLIQEQMKKGGSSSNLWALRQLADFMASHGSPAALPVSPSNMMMVTPINDLHGWEPGSLVKGERLMRCKLASTHRLFDLYGWAQLSHTLLTLRVSKEQEHFLVLPEGLAYSEVTGSSLVKVNLLGEVVEKGSTNLQVDTDKFSLHSAIYSARPDVRCLLHLHTPATAAVSAMKSGLLPLSHEALLVGDVAYYDYNGVVGQEEDRMELQKSLGPTCKVLVLRNHGIVALGESMEEAFYTIYHIQAACQIQVSALCSSGGEHNLIMLDRAIHKPNPTGTVSWAGSTFGPLHKSRTGEHEFEALMRTLDNLGYRTGYAYRFPVLLERTRTRREVEVPATVTVFHQFDDDGVHPALRQHPFAQRQQQERTRWLNTPNTYQKVSQEEASPGHQRTTWLKTEELTQAGSTAIKIENPNQFVPLFTNPQEVIETRNKIRQQNRQDMKTAGPQSQVLASVITDDSPPTPVSPPKVPPEPEPPNPFNELTDKELEEYRKEVERKRDGGTDGEEVENGLESPPATSPTNGPAVSLPPVSAMEVHNDSPVIQNGGDEEKQVTKELEEGMKALSTNDTSSTPATPPVKPQGGTPEGSPCKSPSKKKKKFKPPSFLKKSKKQKEKVET